MRAWQISRLAIRDLWHDRLVSLCMVATLVAVIAPLLLLFGLKHGVVSAMQDELMRDPRNLEVRMLTSGSYDQAWIDELAGYPDVGFTVGMTRSLNTQADFIHSAAKFLENVEVLPTANGDPLMDGIAVQALPKAGVIFSAQAAQRLDVRPADVLRMRIARRLNGVDQRAVVDLTVLAVLPGRVYDRPAAFVQPALLRDMEWYRDGFAVSALGATDGQDVDTAKVRFARARVYATDLNAVEGLERRLNDRRIETSSRLADIRNVRAINHLLTTVFGVISITAVAGCAAALAGAFLASVRRKRRDIATLRLLGLRGGDIAVLLAAQALVLTIVAMGAGLAIYYMGSAVFNNMLGGIRDTGRFACQITPLHAGLAFVLALGVAMLASMIGAATAKRIQPAESLREI